MQILIYWGDPRCRSQCLSFDKQWDIYYPSPSQKNNYGKKVVTIFSITITQVASYEKCRETEKWKLNRAHHRPDKIGIQSNSQWIDKSTAYTRSRSRASLTPSNLGYYSVKREYQKMESSRFLITA